MLMKNAGNKTFNQLTVLHGLEGIELLLKELKKDKSLPSFVEFFMICFILGNTEKVNLKFLYPAVHDKISSWLATKKDFKIEIDMHNAPLEKGLTLNSSDNGNHVKLFLHHL